MSERGTLYIIGIDGATFNIIDPMVKEGRLPNIKRLLDSGASAPLRSTVPPLSPVAWTSMSTGVGPAKHGIIDFVTYDKSDGRTVLFDASHRRVRPIWSVLSDSGKKCCVINVPLTYPVDQVNGFMISGLGTPPTNTGHAHPLEEYDSMVKSLGGYAIDITMERNFGKPGRIKEELGRVMRKRVGALRHCLNLAKWDLFYFVFTNTDRAQHFFWRYHDPSHPLYNASEAAKFGGVIRDTYAEIDEALGLVLDKAGASDTIMLVSDHGFGPLTRKYSLAKWLGDHGYLKLNPAFKPPRVGGLRTLLKRLVPVGLVRFIVRNVLKDKYRFRGHMLDAQRAFDLGATKVFSPKSTNAIFLYFNDALLSGAQSRGELFSALRASLLEMKDPDTGKQLVLEVLDGHVLFGSASSSTPDVVIDLDRNIDFGFELSYLAEGNFLEEDNIWSGVHEPEGIFVLSGPGVKRGVRLAEFSLLDVAPTAYYLTGAPVPEGLDGAVATVAFEEDFLRANPVTSEARKMEEAAAGGALSEEDAEALTRRLQDLGYL